ncbi:hypothetical protein TFLX_02939 [Thermoflexales bacterium]|nr:hypothetical protein TFLX_02939 [Thermoflexales bacterium]
MEKIDRAWRRNPTREVAGETHRFQAERGVSNRQPSHWEDGQADEGRETEKHATGLGEWRRDVPVIVMPDLAMQHANAGQCQQSENNAGGYDRALS